MMVHIRKKTKAAMIYKAEVFMFAALLIAFIFCIRYIGTSGIFIPNSWETNIIAFTQSIDSL